jgi:nitrate/TMAO reductase-like tetraheme cytochrome c subunit
VRRLWGSLAVLWVLQAVAYGQESRFQADPVEHYASRFLIGALALGIGLLLYSLIVYRGRIVGAASWSLLIGSIVVLPGVSMLVGTILLFERAERVEFCLSCHLTMKPYVDDLRNPNSKSLASLHYRNRYIPANQCYQCHTSYGMFGTVQAKMAGMIDVYKYYTKTYHFPIKMREPYPNTDCLKCHAESAKWGPVHQDFKEALFSGEMTCMQCHADSTPAHTISR